MEVFICSFWYLLLVMFGRFVLRVLFINCFAEAGEPFLGVLCVELEMPCRDLDWFLSLFSMFSLWFILWQMSRILLIWIRVRCHWPGTEEFLVWCGMLPRGKMRSIPLPYSVWINRPQGLTARAVRMKAKATCTPWPITGWTKKGMQVTLVVWPEEIEEEEKAKLLAKPFSTKMIPFRQRKFGKDSLVLRTEVGG